MPTVNHVVRRLAAVAVLSVWALPAQSDTLTQVRERGTIRIAIANEIPYGYADLSGEAKGAGPDVARHIAKALGIENIKWETASFSALIPGLKAGRFDMVAAEMAVLPQRCQQVLFSEPNTSYGEGLLVAQGNPKGLNSFEQFSQPGMKVAIMSGADQLEMLQALGVPEANMVTIANNADAISTVSTGRADAYAATSLTVTELAAKSDKVEQAADFSDPMIDGSPVRSWGAFTFAQGAESLQQAVNEALAAFKKTDEWQAILRNNGFSEADIEQSTQRTTQQLCS
ncbi:ectoine/hydroxyectoine ABC transporter substrate-binding protein EhuB [Pusillimonas sp. NJUB218]|uniref:ectoine/hydroxyectoine ABC transporter substrate-binding protein EhuB n=1 Tax=Pusillimonas sp. NJUB218 TaxID=2023230 RepID=UPI000F4C54ED|nr:ectoine/hydroxyectoine ABC transporter substrate-binding protein EhuB [Pusillimonas sp. NJUB218]ROT46219.1 ectoine/hydroxyectoine ABC transporter substrate-binding protein EhuB [Pusillimonas sp. NJUB218]